MSTQMEDLLVYLQREAKRAEAITAAAEWIGKINSIDGAVRETEARLVKARSDEAAAEDRLAQLVLQQQEVDRALGQSKVTLESLARQHQDATAAIANVKESALAEIEAHRAATLERTAAEAESKSAAIIAQASATAKKIEDEANTRLAGLRAETDAAHEVHKTATAAAEAARAALADVRAKADALRQKLS